MAGYTYPAGRKASFLLAETTGERPSSVAGDLEVVGESRSSNLGLERKSRL